MSVHVTSIVLAVEDLDRAKKFYGDGLGCAIEQDYPNFVLFKLGDGSSTLGLYPREAAAQEVGVSPAGSGFRGVSFHYIVDSHDAVDETIRAAVTAGGAVAKAAEAAQWGGYFGYFSDPDGFLWKVATPN